MNGDTAGTSRQPVTTPDLSRSGSQLVDGPAGPMEILIDLPQQAACGIVVLAHPQPLMGGSARHKVPHFLARGLAEAGWLVLRPNFRGVGRSAGTHDAGEAETDDLLALCHRLRAMQADLRLALVGFSFGAYVQARVAQRLADEGLPAWRTCLAGMPFGEVESGRRYATPDAFPDALVIHGEYDAIVPLSAVLDWARPETRPVVVVPGADHFFTGRLPVLRGLVVGHLRSRDAA